MSKEEAIRSKLSEKFKCLDGKFRIQRERRIFVDVPSENFMEVFGYAVKQMDFSVLCTITGLDEGNNLSFIYHISRENSIVLNIRITVPKDNPAIETITGYFPAAELYERELTDLFGAKVRGLPDGKRYPLPDDWPSGQYPLRKDWKRDSEQKEKVEQNG